MDGDAWGSLWGFALTLKNMWKQVQGINDTHVPEMLQFLWNLELIDPELDVAQYNPDIIISLDSSDTGRLGETYLKWESEFQKRPLIVIDHHISNPLFGDINIVDPDASSVCEMMTHILHELSLESHITPEAASFFYTGLQTDSNMYFNTNTRAQTLEAGAMLLKLWADFRTPISELYKKRTQNQITLWQHAFSNLQYSHNGEVCACKLDFFELQSLGIDTGELSGYFKGLISEIMINIEWVKIAYLIYPLSETENKVSMRSQEGYNVAEICETFWGWGHKQASGIQGDFTQETIEKQLIQEILKQL